MFRKALSQPQPQKNRVSQRRIEECEERCLMTAWYAAPNGTATNSGTLNSPWDLATALTKNGVIVGGDTLYLREGTYRHPNRAPGTKGYGFHLDGAAAAPITIRPYQSEHATIDGGLQTIDGTVSEYVTIMGLEVIVSENLTQSRASSISGSDPPADLQRPWGGIDIRSGKAIKIVNNVIHDNMQGVGMWSSVAGNSEIYGNVIHDNGWIAPDRRHGHGIYVQNATPDWKYLRDNLIFDNYSMQVSAYGSPNANVDRISASRNVFWTDGTSQSGAFLLGGERPSQSIRATENIGFDGDLRIGYVNGGNDAVVTGNRVQGSIQFRQWTNLTASNNFAWALSSTAVPTVDGVAVPIPTSPYVAIYANTYDARRAHVAIQNYLSASYVDVNPTAVLRVGDAYQLRDPDDMWGAPVVQGVFTGVPIRVPTPTRFAAFVLTASAGSNTAPTISNIAKSTVTVGTAVPLKSFTVGDAQTAAGSLTVAAQSSNATLIPVTGLLFGGSGANRTLQVNPVAGLTGSSTITVTVRDAGGLTASDAFIVTVKPANTPPTISNILDSTVSVGAAIPLKSFTIADAQTAATALVVTVQSSNTSLVPSGNLFLMGSGSTRSLYVMANNGSIGSSTITVTVRDAGGLTARDSFVVTVNGPGATITSPAREARAVMNSAHVYQLAVDKLFGDLREESRSSELGFLRAASRHSLTTATKRRWTAS